MNLRLAPVQADRLLVRRLAAVAGAGAPLPGSQSEEAVVERLFMSDALLAAEGRSARMEPFLMR